MEYSKLLSRLQNQCSKREYCTMDIRKKALTALEGDAKLASEIVEALQKDKYVDDGRYASAFAREKARIAGWGPVKIRYALSMKGISRQQISDALEDIDDREASRRMRTVLEVKNKALKGDPQCKYKLIKFGLSRGYEYSEISEVVNDLVTNQEEDF